MSLARNGRASTSNTGKIIELSGYYSSTVSLELIHLRTTTMFCAYKQVPRCLLAALSC